MLTSKIKFSISKETKKKLEYTCKIRDISMAQLMRLMVQKFVTTTSSLGNTFYYEKPPNSDNNRNTN